MKPEPGGGGGQSKGRVADQTRVWLRRVTAASFGNWPHAPPHHHHVNTQCVTGNHHQRQPAHRKVRGCATTLHCVCVSPIRPLPSQLSSLFGVGSCDAGAGKSCLFYEEWKNVVRRWEWEWRAGNGNGVRGGGRSGVCGDDRWLSPCVSFLDQIERGSSINGYTVLCSIVCIGVLVGLRCGAGRWLEKVVLCIASG